MSETTPVTPVKRGAIIGTASTYKSTPWQEQDLDILSLNDAYVLPGFARASGWFDLHPIPEMVFRPKGERRVLPQHAPVGGYLRPEGHLDWLKSRDFPVFLHDCREAGCAELPAEKRSHAPYDFPTWKNAHPFPFKAIQAQYGAYFSSTPAWMLAWMLLQGYNQIHIYGIHLATENEYIEQRPNFEFLIGCLLGVGKRRLSVSQGLRRYETQDGLLVLPESSPILQATYQYAFEPSPRRLQAPLRWELHKAQTKRDRRAHALMVRPWWNPLATVVEPGDEPETVTTRRVWPSTLAQELQYYDALVGDCHEQLQRMSAGI